MKHCNTFSSPLISGCPAAIRSVASTAPPIKPIKALRGTTSVAGAWIRYALFMQHCAVADGDEMAFIRVRNLECDGHQCGGAVRHQTHAHAVEQIGGNALPSGMLPRKPRAALSACA